LAIGVYLIELNGKKYVGSAAHSIAERLSDHLRTLRHGIHGNSRLQNAYNKYGESTLCFKILETVELPEECVPMEQKYIDKLKPEYNICLTAGSSLGIKRSMEYRKKLSIAHLGQSKPHTEESKRKISIAHMGKILSDEHRAKLSAAHRGKTLTKEHCEKITAALLGRCVSEETRAKISLARMGICFSEEHIQKLRDAWVVRKKRQPSTEATSVSVINLDTGMVFISIAKARESSGQNCHIHITEVCRGKRKTAGGYRWAYYEK
jgi:group I intron endonuclease